MKVTKNDPEPIEADGFNKGYLERSIGNFIGLKLHLVYKLISNSLKKIDTLYPSKYLNIVSFFLWKYY